MAARLDADRTAILFALGLGGLLAVFLAVQPPLQGSLVLLAVGGALFALFNPRATLYLVIPAMSLSPDIPLHGLALRLEDVLMVPLTAGWFARRCVGERRWKTSLDGLLIAYLVVGVAATCWGGYLGTANFSTVDKYTSSPFHLFKRLEFVLLFFIVTDTLRRPVEVRHVTYVLMASLIGLETFGLLTFLSNKAIAAAPAGAPGHEPGLASMVNIALALSLFPAARGPAKLLLAGVILFSLAVLPLTLGRNYIVTSLLIILYVGLFRQPWILVLLPLPWLLGTYFYAPHVVERVLTLQNALAPDITGAQSGGASLLSRSTAPSEYALLTLRYSPLLGYGLGSIALGAIDSEYVTQLAYTGLVGLVVFALFGARLLRLTAQTARLASNPLDAALAQGFQLVFIAYAIHSIFSASISSIRGGGFLFIIVGLLAVLHRSLMRSAEEPQYAAIPSVTPAPAALRP